MVKRLAPSVPTEYEVQRRVVALYRALNCKVYSLSQGYRPGGKRHGTTRQTKGLADLYVIPPQRNRPGSEGMELRRPWWHEVKRPGGVVSPEQREFDARNREAGTVVVTGGVEEAVAHLNTLGYRLGARALPNTTEAV